MSGSYTFSFDPLYLISTVPLEDSDLLLNLGLLESMVFHQKSDHFPMTGLGNNSQGLVNPDWTVNISDTSHPMSTDCVPRELSDVNDESGLRLVHKG
jgi:hypothetical protein